jgi:Protein UNC80
MLALMTASARFHRLFTTGGGYTLFIPALFKVYAEAESNEGVRRAIEYSINRFYAVHQEAFVFQALNMLSHLVMVSEVDGPWIAKQIFLLLSTLKDDAPIHAPDAAGIHGSNKIQEHEALMLRTAEERPQAFLALLRRTSGSQGEDVGAAVPDQYDSSHLSLDNFVRLFLTVIGHDPNIRRAEQFLRLLRLMAPYFFDASPLARGVLLEGINALSLIFLVRSTSKAKANEAPQIRAEESSHSFSQAASASMDAFEAAKSPSNFTEMKFDYLSLVTEVSTAGGSFGPSALRRIFDLTKTILTDGHDGGRVASFLGSFAHETLVRNRSDLQLKQILAFLNELGPIFKAHAGAVDLSKMLEAVVFLVENPVYANQAAFSHVVVTHFCVGGLEVFDRLASDGFAFSTPFRPILVRLLCRATLLTGTDVVSLVEQRPITFEFVAGILYPMALNLPSAADLASDTRWMEAWRRAAIRRMWVCLLQRAMLACQRQKFTSTSDKTEKSSQPERRRSHEKKRDVVKNYSAATLTIALQTLKIIVLKAEDELSSSLPNIWVEMGLLLKRVLSTGNARFAIQDRVTSVPSSPLQPSPDLKPRTSEDSDLLMPPSPHIPPSRFHSPQPPPCPQPFLVDYLLWSMLYFICRHRSPLMLQLRLFLQEATATLDEELHAQQAPAIRSKRFSYTSVFAKTPQRSGHRSKVPSPEASPFLTPLGLYHGDVLLTPPKPERKPGYARSPTTPGGSEVVEPRIVHLGPVQNFDMFRRSPSPGLGESGTISRKWTLAKSITISSTKLVQTTYWRVRAVQRFMGYTGLLPAPDGADGSMDDARAWSKGIALNEIEGETTELVEEFWSEDE